MSQSEEKSEFVEDVPPASGKLVDGRPSHTDRTRRDIAYALLGLMGVTIVGTLVAVVFGRLTVDEMKEVSLLITPIATLTGTAIGFYFASDQKGQ